MNRRFALRYEEGKAYLGNKCVDCGTSEMLEFDHIDPSLKTGNIGDLWSYSSVRFWEEVEKCVLRCEEHHHERTIQQLSVEHGGGLSGKKNCPCDLCKARKAQYQRDNAHKYNEAHNARRREQRRIDRETKGPDPLAQLAERRPFKSSVQGSSPWGITVAATPPPGVS